MVESVKSTVQRISYSTIPVDAHAINDAPGDPQEPLGAPRCPLELLPYEPLGADNWADHGSYVLRF